ncbi:MAG: OB-fold nucleic acid binding domain-containing protein [Nanoarchaeota archaeon]|nr:OB-fold nucleic acid binding domain-containing protein [Nanoarchaeota archaeon]MBU1445125.1 OB-fold nucleic acid binding domain-containing protein [Nanoarchaeota archaeon]MBU2406666.1 OB-fold nucleic acid binding domain-containing protein [Nanoarchaeota archaeon]MBU2420089.1 OB-fold nucleic acid binding domain-containing protein [Nanoarchaeota archaeon]MBU2475552.1 OB-fold nucleic acid binding domain-containing protein [Nanoarchaeota archaeon]
MAIQRQTAYKVWISDLISNPYKKDPGEWSPNYIEIKDKKVSRVNIIATTIMKYENQEGGNMSITLDDSSASIRVKVWKDDIKLLQDIQIGDTILVIGRPRQFSGEIYIVPEIVNKVENPTWQKIRKLELEKEFGVRQKLETPVLELKQPEMLQPLVEEETVEETSETDRQKILNLIEKDDGEKGAELSKIILESQIPEEKANLIIEDLLKEGEIFKPTTSTLKLLK